METTRVPMRTLTSAEAVETWDQVLLGYDPEEAIQEARRSLAFDLGPATAECPYHVNAQRLVDAIARGAFDEAASVVYEAHPFAQVLGMHCHRYCENALVPNHGKAGPGGQMGGWPGWVPNLSALEWAAGRHGAPPPFVAGSRTGHRIAMVGAGSGSLMCAWVLRQLGHAVDIFDREALPGGLLQTGYPSFRMNKAVVQAENDPTEWGAGLYLSHSVDADELARLIAEYNAVFIATGRSPVRSFGGLEGPPIEGEELDGVLTGMDVLREMWYGRPPQIGPHVMVFGGGWAAVDVVRTARRLGYESELVYRRGEPEMWGGGISPAAIQQLRDEGIALRLMADPDRILGHDGKVTAVELVRMEYDGVDPAGRRATRVVTGTGETYPVDTIVRCIGELYEIQPVVEPNGIETVAGGFIRIDPISRRTTNPKVWAGGDVASSRGNDGSSYDGLWAARAIDAYLQGDFDRWRAEAEASGDARLLAHNFRG